MNIEEFRRLPKSTKRRMIDANRDYYLYRCYDADGVLLYIGCSNDVEKRIYIHMRSNARVTASWWLSVCMDRYEVEGPFRGQDAGREAERNAIRAEQPLFNTQERGKTYSRVRNEVAGYLISKGHGGLAVETACTCSKADLAELGQEFSPWCVAHLPEWEATA